MSVLYAVREIKTCASEEETNKLLETGWKLLEVYLVKNTPRFLLGRVEG